ncbi:MULTISPECIES: protein translocase subunit SecD [Coprococcus]|jgi:SecD/SecF fusion protein|uniref:protein translocase subunit SecD n=1 Tax=Coprococcus TaxID=33042 RepID=UPI000E40EBFE|nr:MULTISPECIES: protein translocase subunit SecD [Coprococcus]MBD9290743.1 protein translocase subunit SecD [Coprococcus eutactus]MBD9292300.1 protein translocase subunit SecD [Coprococcus eutactus]RGD39875.1 protein translocase subunit SecD [Coprococcus sp. AM14-16]
MKKTKRNAVLVIIAFLLILGVAIYTAIFGVADRGKVEYIKLGLDLKGGLSVTYEIQEDDYSDKDLEDTKYKIEQRVEAYTNEYSVYEDGDKKITAEIPGVTNADEILNALNIEGKLEFLDPDNYTKWSQGQEYEAALTGDDIKNATAGIDSDNGNDNVVQLAFTDEGAQKFADVTAANVGNIVYIIYDNKVVSAPTVQSAITGGSAEINKIGSYEEAEQLATTIRIGALPLTLKQVRSNIVGATLGSDAISTSLKAGAIGIALVFLIMIIVFRIPGLVASFALAFYTILDLLVLNLFNVTLTLPGIAGVILSVGMAVDANVIIFTRIKEELADGKSVKQAVKGGFHNALSAIIDGNVTTLIAALVLGIFGTGTIKGFAITLAIGVVLSVFTALAVSQSLLTALVNLGVTDAKYFGVAREPKKTNFVKAGKFCMLGSLIVIIACFCMMPVNNKSKGSPLNFSVEFAGGTSLTVGFDKEYSLSEAEKDIVPVIAEAAGIGEAGISVQTVSGTNEIVFKMPELSDDGTDDSQMSKVRNALTDKLGADVKEANVISGSVSSEMSKNAIFSVILAAILMLIYIAIRFHDVKFGASAVIALLHDVAMVFCLYIILRLTVGNTCIACLLTIVGYSINATIIIFDRVRENIGVMKPKKATYKDIVNLSINQTFSRTIYTSLTTFVTIFVLYIMGVASIKEFALTLMAGVVIGAYSSVCITGPLWYYMKTKLGKTEKDA